MKTTAKLRRRTNTAARTAVKALYYRAISGTIAVLVDNGHLIRTGDFLNRIGGGDHPHGQQSVLRPHPQKADQDPHGAHPKKVWAQHRTTGRWIHVHVYGPIDEALYVGLHSYKGTRHLLASTFAEAA